ncbi:hypothetical protein K461DRAFT_281330 [Myriangium duriaei CBS 260.36]|uniref:Uncharacterized protein n=1 Tax=Myriangium duriaei CBS 260.36 TaxID=1168546 RepID=A0A9P4IU88_9PEZI|nr:hypothetical protein K461DRAFT_281330 [Myriangium duriaei CBS 260.36]
MKILRRPYLQYWPWPRSSSTKPGMPSESAHKNEHENFNVCASVHQLKKDEQSSVR